MTLAGIVIDVITQHPVDLQTLQSSRLFENDGKCIHREDQLQSIGDGGTSHYSLLFLLMCSDCDMMDIWGCTHRANMIHAQQ